MACIGNKPSDLRVIAGEYKGLRLASPQNPATHPMGSREKNALFNIIQLWLADAVVLDAYAGSGALGIEALSRGARSATFVENHPAALRALRRNLEALAKFAENRPKTELFPENIAKFAENPRLDGYFSLIIADPPYDGFSVSEVANLAKILRIGGILALSYPAKRGAPEFSGLECLTSRHYAAAGIGIYRKIA